MLLPLVFLDLCLASVPSRSAHPRLEPWLGTRAFLKCRTTALGLRFLQNAHFFSRCRRYHVRSEIGGLHFSQGLSGCSPMRGRPRLVPAGFRLTFAFIPSRTTGEAVASAGRLGAESRPRAASSNGFGELRFNRASRISRNRSSLKPMADYWQTSGRYTRLFFARIWRLIAPVILKQLLRFLSFLD